jgi:uncharacterized protein
VIEQLEVILYVADQARSAAFYADALGAAPVLDVPGMTSFAVVDGVRLGLMPADDAAALLGPTVPSPASGAGIPRAELYLVVDDAAALLERFLAAGARPLSPVLARPWGDRAGYVADLDGHVVAIAERGDRI